MSQARLAVDIGGTFTDVVLERDGAHHGVKVLTTPENPADGFMTGVRRVLAETGAVPGAGELLREVLPLHYRYRFRPGGLDADGSRELAARARRWLAAHRADPA